MPGDSEWNVVSKIHFQVAILASAGLSQGAPQSDPSLARILQEQRYQDDDDNDDLSSDKMMIDSTPERASSGPPSPRRTVLSTGRRASATTRGWGSTATSGTMARPTLSSTAPGSTASGQC